MHRQKISMVVSEVEDEASDIRRYILRSASGDGELPMFTAGSHVDVFIGESITRQYSLSCSPAEQGYYELGIQKDVNSRGGSATIHETFQAGTKIEISRPRNNFELDETANAYLLIAGGIGITPLLSMAERLLTIGKPWRLHYAVRDAGRIAFKSRLQSDRFKDFVTISCDDTDGPSDLKTLIGKPASGRRIYCCGPQGLMDAVKGLTGNWPAETVTFEHFTADPLAAEDGDLFKVEIASTGQVFDVPAGKPLLDVLIDNGFDIDWSCRQGICGTCELSIMDGAIEHRDSVLSAKEKKSNKYMMCCVSRAHGGKIVVDL